MLTLFSHLTKFVWSNPYIFLCFFAILLDIVFLRRYLGKKSRNTYIQYHGVETNATIVKLHLGMLVNYLTYIYEHQGKHYKKVQCITQNMFSSIREGEMINIYYLPLHPQESTLTNEHLYYIDLRLVIVLSFLSFLFVLIIISFYLTVIISRFL